VFYCELVAKPVTSAHRIVRISDYFYGVLGAVGIDQAAIVATCVIDKS
jgi:hypothetical protein